MSEELLSQAIEEIWKEFDTDNSGFLNYPEASKFLHRFFQVTSVNVSSYSLQDIAAEIDKNKDKQISKQEMKSFFKNQE